MQPAKPATESLEKEAPENKEPPHADAGPRDGYDGDLEDDDDEELTFDFRKRGAEKPEEPFRPPIADTQVGCFDSSFYPYFFEPFCPSFRVFCCFPFAPFAEPTHPLNFQFSSCLSCSRSFSRFLFGVKSCGSSIVRVFSLCSYLALLFRSVPESGLSVPSFL